MLNRDSIIWWVGLVGGIVTALVAEISAGHLDWISEETRRWIVLLAVLVSAVSGKLATSPLPGKEAANVGAATAKVVEATRQLTKVQDREEADDHG